MPSMDVSSEHFPRMIESVGKVSIGVICALALSAQSVVLAWAMMIVAEESEKQTHLLQEVVNRQEVLDDIVRVHEERVVAEERIASAIENVSEHLDDMKQQ